MAKPERFEGANHEVREVGTADNVPFALRGHVAFTKWRLTEQEIRTLVQTGGELWVLTAGPPSGLAVTAFDLREMVSGRPQGPYIVGGNGSGPPDA